MAKGDEDILSVYRDVCDGRFAANEKRQNRMEGKLDEMFSIVKNGLSHRVKMVWGLIWVLFALLVALLASQIAIVDMLIQHLKL